MMSIRLIITYKTFIFFNYTLIELAYKEQVSNKIDYWLFGYLNSTNNNKKIILVHYM